MISSTSCFDTIAIIGGEFLIKGSLVLNTENVHKTINVGLNWLAETFETMVVRAYQVDISEGKYNKIVK